MWLAVTTLWVAATPVKLAAVGLTGSGVPVDRVAFLSEYVAAQVARHGVEVVTQKELQSVLGMERQKQLLGCSEAASECLAELASALGTDGLLLGDIAFIADGYLVNLKVIRASSGKPVAVQSFDAKSEAELVERLKESALALALETRRVLRGEVVAVTVSKSTGPSRKLALLPAGIGLVAAVAGAVLIAQSQSMFELLATGSNVTDPDAQRARSSGPTFRAAGWGIAGVGIAALVGAAAWWLLGSDSAPVSAEVTPSSAVILFGGAWP